MHISPTFRICVLLLLLALIAGACRHQTISIDGSGADSDSDTDVDTDSDGDTDTFDEYPANGVDILVVVDNSGSMQEEQWILADHVFHLTEGLAAEIDSVRVAVVSSNMGLQWGGNPYEDGDGWPGDAPQGCGSVGDNGEFQTYTDGKTITLDDQPFECPGMAAMWVETPFEDEPNPGLPGQVACLTSLGTSGCGWEQQLQSAAVAVTRPDQAGFHVDDHLLAVIAVSDEDDCSIESNALFAMDEVQNLAAGEVNLACGRHPEHLYLAESYAAELAAPKGGNPNGLVFAAIVGVPPGDGDDLSDCEGRGDAIDGCLDHPDMELEVVQEGDAYFFAPACERWEATEQVTKARPGRRFVELAREKGGNGAVYSICRADWGIAMDGIAQMINDEIAD